MERAGFIISIAAIIIAVFSFVPFTAWLNWLNIPLALTGLIVNLTAYLKNEDKGDTGFKYPFIFCGVAILIGIIRLIIGVGFI